MVEEVKGKEAEEPKQVQQTPTAEEQLKTLQSQFQALTSEKERLEGGYKGLQRTLDERTKEGKKAADLESRFYAMQDSIELLATAVSAKGGIENLEPDERKDILADLKKRRQEQELKRKQEESQRTQEEYIQKGAVIYAKAEEVFGDDVETLHYIRNCIRANDLDLAERKITKAEKKETPKVVETEEEKRAKMKREIMDELGLLEEHSALPSGRSQSFADIEGKYAKGEITTAEYRKAREKEGIF